MVCLVAIELHGFGAIAARDLERHCALGNLYRDGVDDAHLEDVRDMEVTDKRAPRRIVHDGFAEPRDQRVIEVGD